MSTEIRAMGADLIAAERQRQVEREGWTPEHDDAHDRCELVEAAQQYVMDAHATALGVGRAKSAGDPPPGWWPWENEAYKPSDDPVRNLVKAGALIAAEIDRLQRAAMTDPIEAAFPTGETSEG